jgi:polar amino acid transport system substrate-binding protein
MLTGTRTRLVAALVAATAVMGIAAGCGSSDDSTTGGSSGGEALTVGSDIPYPPFEQGKAPNYTGFDIDLVNAMAKEMGRDVTYEDTSFDTIFRDLAQGKFDMVASATTITPDREKTVDFTNPYYLSEQALVVPTGSDIATVDDISGATVAVQQGTTGQIYVEDETDAGEVRQFPAGPDAINAVKTGTSDAAVIDLPVAQDAVSKTEGIEVATSIPTDEQYGFVVQQDDTALLDDLNNALKAIQDDGTYTEIYKKWFDQEPPKEVFTATNEPK